MGMMLVSSEHEQERLKYFILPVLVGLQRITVPVVKFEWVLKVITILTVWNQVMVDAAKFTNMRIAGFRRRNYAVRRKWSQGCGL